MKNVPVFPYSILAAPLLPIRTLEFKHDCTIWSFKII